MNTQSKQIVKNQSGSSFEIVLEETLNALYERRLEINRLLRSLEAEKREKSGQRFRIKQDGSLSELIETH